MGCGVIAAIIGRAIHVRGIPAAAEHAAAGAKPLQSLIKPLAVLAMKGRTLHQDRHVHRSVLEATHHQAIL